MSSKVFSNKIINFLNKYNKYPKRELLIIQYGLESFYLFVTKFIIIILISLLVNITKELLIFTSIYAVIKSPSFGMHASSSKQCLIFSTILFISVPYLCTINHLDSTLVLLLGNISLIIFLLYSPADTHKKPIINKKRRIIYKIISSFLCLIYTIIALNIENHFLINCLIYSLLTQSFFISPISYHLFKQPYNNYKKLI